MATKIKQNQFKNKNILVNPLDKLAQLAPEKKYTLETLVRRAKAKYFTNAYTVRLAMLKSPLQKSYNNTIFGCSALLYQTGKTITSTYCNNRWCVVCNRIRTAKQIIGYKKPLSELKEKYFVTLTIPNVDKEILRAEIQQMIKNFQLIKKSFAKSKTKFIGIRKLECTYNPILKNYHPHFHLIVNGKENADRLVNEWLKRYTNAKIIAQDIRICDDNSMMELFKYFTKIITNKAVYIEALDVIFRAMRGLRVYQPFSIQKVTEDIDEIEKQIIEDLIEAEKTWEWIENDWVYTPDGECLTGYTPDEQMVYFVQNIK